MILPEEKQMKQMSALVLAVILLIVVNSCDANTKTKAAGERTPTATVEAYEMNAGYPQLPLNEI